MRNFGLYVLFSLLFFLWAQEAYGAWLDCSGYPEPRAPLKSAWFKVSHDHMLVTA